MMNMRLEKSQTTVAVLPVTFGRPRPLAQASIVPLADAVSAVVFDETHAADPAARPRLSARVDGEILSRPVISTRLDLRGEGRRHVLIAGRGADSLVGRAITLDLDGRPAASVEPHWLQPPLADGAALIDNLTDGGRRRLLKLFLTTGASLFGDARAPEFGAAALRLLSLLGVSPLSLASWCPFGTSGCILSYRIAGPLDTTRIGDLVALSDDRITRIKAPRFTVEQAKDRRILHVHIPGQVPADVALIGLGAAPIHLRATDALARPQPLAPWLERRDDATRAWAHGLIEAAAPADPAVRTLMREIRHGADLPQARLRHLSATGGGVLVSLDLADRHGLLRAIRFERGPVVAEAPVRPAAGALAAFVPLPRRSLFGDSCRIRLVYRSGRCQTVHEGAAPEFDGAAPAGFGGATRDEAAEALARARLSMAPRAPFASTEDFGVAPGEPRLSLVCAIGENFDLLRARAAMIFREPAAARVEIICHMADGPGAAAARGAIATAAAVFGLAHRLVILPPGASASEGLRGALALARAPAALALGAEVLPAGPGWLAQWLRLSGGASARPITSGLLLAADGSVLDAGARIAPGGTAWIEHPSRGLPSGRLPRGGRIETDLPPAACVGLNRVAIDHLVSAPVSYPDPDVLLAAAAAAFAPAAAQLRAQFVSYRVPSAPDPLEETARLAALRLVLPAATTEEPA